MSTSYPPRAFNIRRMVKFTFSEIKINTFLHFQAIFSTAATQKLVRIVVKCVSKKENCNYK